jgi:hypothetical protein
MTAVDMPRFRAAVLRVCACYDKALTSDQRDAWYDQLERYPIDALETALRAAPAESGRFFPSVGLIEQLTRKALAATPRSTGDWHAPEVMRDEAGIVTIAYRCGLCCDTGWRARVAANGVILTEMELQASQDVLRVPRADGKPTYTMTRCACRTGGVA